MKNNSATIPIDFEYLLSHLFGKQNYHAVTGTNNVKFLKNSYKRIFTSIKKSIELNVISADQVLVDELFIVCDNALDELKRKANAEVINIKMSSYFRVLIQF